MSVAGKSYAEIERGLKDIHLHLDEVIITITDQDNNWVHNAGVLVNRVRLIIDDLLK